MRAMPDLNGLWATHALTPTEYTLADLLDGVTSTVSLRYRKLHSDADDIAQLVAVKCWRSLPCYAGDRPLKNFDPLRGSFNAYVSCLARTTVLDVRKVRDSLIPTADSDLERLAAGFPPVQKWENRSYYE